jgi:hypothetical protein
MSDGSDSRHEFHGVEKTPFPFAIGFVSGRLLEHFDRTGRKRFVRLEHLGTVGRRRHNQNRRRTMRHDVFRRAETRHHRQHHVHRHHVGTECLTQVNGLLAVARLGYQLDLRIRGERGA